MSLGTGVFVGAVILTLAVLSYLTARWYRKSSQEYYVRYPKRERRSNQEGGVILMVDESYPNIEGDCDE